MTAKKIIIVALLIVVGLIAAASVAFSMMAASFEKRMAALRIDAIDLTRVADGTYEGACDFKIVSAVVSATVAGGRLADLKLLKHSHGPRHSGEAIISRILQKQSLQVDALTGATSSGKVILKATQEALSKGLR